jgi:hypothetical protein
MWTKVDKKKGADQRQSFAVVRWSNAAALIVPGCAVVGERADVYVDGNRIGYRIGDSGEFSVSVANKASVAKRVTIPSRFVGMVPEGTTDATVTMEGGMIVLDLDQFRGMVK